MNSNMQVFPLEDVQKSALASKKWPVFVASPLAGNRPRNFEKSNTSRLSGSLPFSLTNVSNLQPSIWRKTVSNQSPLPQSNLNLAGDLPVTFGA